MDCCLLPKKYFLKGLPVVLVHIDKSDCDVWCRGLTTCLLHVGPPFGNRILNNSWAVGLT